MIPGSAAHQRQQEKETAELDNMNIPKSILVLTKRQYTNKDLLNDRYGRVWELPAGLARSGNRISGLTLSYRIRGEGSNVIEIGNDDAYLKWTSVNLGYFFPLGILKYLLTLYRIIREEKPDVLFATSDALHIILASWLGKIIGAKVVLDLYDNYESFWPTRLPVVRRVYQGSLKSADEIVCVSEPLKQFLNDKYGLLQNVTVIENGIPENKFYSKDKIACRQYFKLPLEGKLIGTAGTIDESRGIQHLISACQDLVKKNKDIFLVLAGPLGRSINLAPVRNIIYVGNIDYDLVNDFLNSLDVAVVCNVDSEFGKYCFPQKAYEIIAAGIPVVAASGGALEEKLCSCQNSLYKTGSSKDLASVLENQINMPSKCAIEVPTWDEQSLRLKDVMEKSVPS